MKLLTLSFFLLVGWTSAQTVTLTYYSGSLCNGIASSQVFYGLYVPGEGDQYFVISTKCLRSTVPGYPAMVGYCWFAGTNQSHTFEGAAVDLYSDLSCQTSQNRLQGDRYSSCVTGSVSGPVQSMGIFCDLYGNPPANSSLYDTSTLNLSNASHLSVSLMWSIVSAVLLLLLSSFF